MTSSRRSRGVIHDRVWVLEDAADKNNLVKEQEFLYQILQFV